VRWVAGGGNEVSGMLRLIDNGNMLCLAPLLFLCTLTADGQGNFQYLPRVPRQRRMMEASAPARGRSDVMAKTFAGYRAR
jgi:hypothetical protein